MKNYKYLLLGIILTQFLAFNSAKSQTIDTYPLDAYWKMIEPLKQNDSLSKTTWDKFLSIDANQTFIKNQGFSNTYLENLRKNIQYVYMPKYDSLFKARVKAIEKDPSTYWITYKVYVYKQYEKELKQYQKQLLEPSYTSTIYKNAYEWLPKKLHQKDTSVNIHFLGIENDAIAGSGTVIATLWQVYNQDKLKNAGLLGHEMHHVLRKPIDFGKVDEQDKGLIYLLNSILNEGSADMIDKVVNIANDANLPMGIGFKDFELFQADSIVNQINSNITVQSISNGKIFKTEKDYRNLIRWSSGHCPGYYMTDIIVRNGYRKKLLKNIQNPFAFIYLYNKAAKKDSTKPTVFSDETINYVKLLEKKYLPKS